MAMKFVTRSCAALAGAAIALSGLAAPAQAAPEIYVYPDVTVCDEGEAVFDVYVEAPDGPGTATLSTAPRLGGNWTALGTVDSADAEEDGYAGTFAAPSGEFWVGDDIGPLGLRYGMDCAAGETFSDVPADLQFFMEIEWLATRNITTGWGEDTYRPFASVNRDAMAAFLYRLAGRPAFTAPATPTFDDVPTTNQFYKEIEWLAANEITTGWGEDTFQPTAPVNRDAMAAYFFRMFDHEHGVWDPEEATPFTDVTTTTQFHEEIAWMADAGIAGGWEDGTYRPVAPVARDAMAAFVMRYEELDQLYTWTLEEEPLAPESRALRSRALQARNR